MASSRARLGLVIGIGVAKGPLRPREQRFGGADGPFEDVRALADGTVVLDPGCDWNRARQQLLALPGIGPWTAEVIAMRGLGDPDAFPVTDLGVLAAAKALGLPSDPKVLTERSGRWRPWRAYATQHLWTALEHEVNYWPPKTTEKDK